MSRIVWFMLLALIGLTILASVGPVLAVLIRALVPLVLAVGLIVGLLRIVWYFTSRY